MDPRQSTIQKLRQTTWLSYQIVKIISDSGQANNLLSLINNNPDQAHTYTLTEAHLITKFTFSRADSDFKIKATRQTYTTDSKTTKRLPEQVQIISAFSFRDNTTQ